MEGAYAQLVDQEQNPDAEKSGVTTKTGSEPSTLAQLITLFWLVVLAEMGDRSQISAVGLAAKYTLFSLIIGGSTGHALACALASLCGNFIGQHCSEKCINIAGGLIFLGFSAYSLVFDLML